MITRLNESLKYFNNAVYIKKCTIQRLESMCCGLSCSRCTNNRPGEPYSIWNCRMIIKNSYIPFYASIK